ncbi:MAG: FkbM family methyltransferase [Lachnospiraceae bacterium]|nr:FkbM family methyltransferase [Lachnospiraceae bacterium]
MEQIQIDQIKEIYHLLGDDISKYIFENRLLYSLTEDVKFIRNIACTTKPGKRLYTYLKSDSRKKVLFGAGEVGGWLLRFYDDIRFECFADNHQFGSPYKGLPVINIQELKERYPKALIIISTRKYHQEIVEQLLKEGFKTENIINLGAELEKLMHQQYFDLPQLERRKMDREIFIDGGCYDGSTSKRFIEWNSGKGEVIAWEPDPDNRKRCKDFFEKNYIHCELISKGLWHEKKELKLTKNGSGSKISDNGDIVFEADRMDHLIKGEVTFIKLDIEGAEYEAILGAKKIIEKYKPKLAICVYHKAEDIWKLPWLIHEIDPTYIFYLRHYSLRNLETVLYAL